MAKLYAEVTSDKGGRVVGKGGNESVTVELKRGNKTIATLRIEHQNLISHHADVLYFEHTADCIIHNKHLG